MKRTWWGYVLVSSFGALFIGLGVFEHYARYALARVGPRCLVEPQDDAPGEDTGRGNSDVQKVSLFYKC